MQHTVGKIQTSTANKDSIAQTTKATTPRREGRRQEGGGGGGERRRGEGRVGRQTGEGRRESESCHFVALKSPTPTGRDSLSKINTGGTRASLTRARSLKQAHSA